MIVAKVFRHAADATDPAGELLMERTFHDSNLTLECVIARIESYIVNEQLNTEGECLVRVRFANLKGATR